jgi:hypothetical protein
MRETTCSTCMYMEPVVVDDAEPETVCRRFPPQGGKWSVVFGDDWCGEWAPGGRVPPRPEA